MTAAAHANGSGNAINGFATLKVASLLGMPCLLELRLSCLANWQRQRVATGLTMQSAGLSTEARRADQAVNFKRFRGHDALLPD